MGAKVQMKIGKAIINMALSSPSIIKSIEYSKKLIDTPYIWWFRKDKIDRESPFYTEDKKCPSIESIKEKGVNCAGLINLISRNSGKKPFGGTIYWFEYNRKNLIDFNILNKYPPGSMLLRQFNDEHDQGHLAMIIDDTNLIHCYPNSFKPIRGKCFPGVKMEKINISHQWDKNGFYTHVLLPEYWL